MTENSNATIDFSDLRDITTETDFYVINGLQRGSAFLSICGSGYIIWDILRNDPDQKKISGVYHRIMLALSLFDMTSSIALFLANWAQPSDTEYAFVYESYGNQMTCNVQGWMILFGWC